MNPRLIRNCAGILSAAISQLALSQSAEKPNVIIIYADDLGYGDVSCYGATSVKTPNIDRAAREGLRFTNAHCSSATSTPSRYSLLTGEYAWRKPRTGVEPVMQPQ
jgi:arylsulfatase A-like enzyme